MMDRCACGMSEDSVASWLHGCWRVMRLLDARVWSAAACVAVRAPSLGRPESRAPPSLVAGSSASSSGSSVRKVIRKSNTFQALSQKARNTFPYMFRSTARTKMKANTESMHGDSGHGGHE